MKSKIPLVNALYRPRPLSAEEAFSVYRSIVTSRKHTAMQTAGDFAASLDDETARAVYDACCADSELKDRLVRPLWYCYERQAYRWEGGGK